MASLGSTEIDEDDLNDADRTLVVLLRGDAIDISSDMTDDEIRSVIEMLQHSLGRGSYTEYVN